jgi:hypothetical protein
LPTLQKRGDASGHYSCRFSVREDVLHSPLCSIQFGSAQFPLVGFRSVLFCFVLFCFVLFWSWIAHTIKERRCFCNCSCRFSVQKMFRMLHYVRFGSVRFNFLPFDPARFWWFCSVSVSVPEPYELKIGHVCEREDAFPSVHVRFLVLCRASHYE